MRKGNIALLAAVTLAGSIACASSADDGEIVCATPGMPAEMPINRAVGEGSWRLDEIVFDIPAGVRLLWDGSFESTLYDPGGETDTTIRLTEEASGSGIRLFTESDSEYAPPGSEESREILATDLDEIARINAAFDCIVASAR